jgi:putative addiction module killer protein
MRTVVEFVTEDGLSPFGRWYARLKAPAAAKGATALYRLELGNLSSSKSVGNGVSEYKIDFGPGYRIYFGQDGDVLVILLGGGTKKGQSDDIRQAQARWTDYKRRRSRAR